MVEKTSKNLDCAVTGIDKPDTIPVQVVPTVKAPVKAGVSVTTAPETGENKLLVVLLLL